MESLAGDLQEMDIEADTDEKRAREKALCDGELHYQSTIPQYRPGLDPDTLHERLDERGAYLCNALLYRFKGCIDCAKQRAFKTPVDMTYADFHFADQLICLFRLSCVIPALKEYDVCACGLARLKADLSAGKAMFPVFACCDASWFPEINKRILRFIEREEYYYTDASRSKQPSQIYPAAPRCVCCAGTWFAYAHQQDKHGFPEESLFNPLGIPSVNPLEFVTLELKDTSLAIVPLVGCPNCFMRAPLNHKQCVANPAGFINSIAYCSHIYQSYGDMFFHGIDCEQCTSVAAVDAVDHNFLLSEHATHKHISEQPSHGAAADMTPQQRLLVWLRVVEKRRKHIGLQVSLTMVQPNCKACSQILESEVAYSFDYSECQEAITSQFRGVDSPALCYHKQRDNLLELIDGLSCQQCKNEIHSQFNLKRPFLSEKSMLLLRDYVFSSTCKHVPAANPNIAELARVIKKQHEKEESAKKKALRSAYLAELVALATESPLSHCPLIETSVRVRNDSRKVGRGPYDYGDNPLIPAGILVCTDWKRAFFMEGRGKAAKLVSYSVQLGVDRCTPIQFNDRRECAIAFETPVVGAACDNHRLITLHANGEITFVDTDGDSRPYPCSLYRVDADVYDRQMSASNLTIEFSTVMDAVYVSFGLHTVAIFFILARKWKYTSKDAFTYDAYRILAADTDYDILVTCVKNSKKQPEWYLSRVLVSNAEKSIKTIDMPAMIQDGENEDNVREVRADAVPIDIPCSIAHTAVTYDSIAYIRSHTGQGGPMLLFATGQFVYSINIDLSRLLSSADIGINNVTIKQPAPLCAVAYDPTTDIIALSLTSGRVYISSLLELTSVCGALERGSNSQAKLKYAEIDLNFADDDMSPGSISASALYSRSNNRIDGTSRLVRVDGETCFLVGVGGCSNTFQVIPVFESMKAAGVVSPFA